MADGEIDFTSPERLKAQKVKPTGPDLNSKELYNYTTSPRDLETNQPPSVKMKMAKTIATEERKMKEMFSAEELAHIASIMEANPISPTDPEVNRTATKVSNTAQVGSSLNTNVVSSRDLTDETIREDFEYGMARNELATADRAIQRLMTHLKGEGEIEAWVQSKITKASDYLDTVADYMDGGKVNEETDCEDVYHRCIREGKDKNTCGKRRLDCVGNKRVKAAYRKESVEQIDEVSAPGQEEMIRSAKPSFKKRYGNRWQQVLYATAWKKAKREGTA